MMNCYDEGTIQAFLDGELDFAATEKFTRHIAVCESCAAALEIAEAETAFAFAAFTESEDFSPLVPTERLRLNILASIADFEKRPTFWSRLKKFSFGWNLATPQFAAAAVLLVTISAAILLLVLPQQKGGKDSLAQAQAVPTENSSNSIVSSSTDESVKTDAPFIAELGDETERENKIHPTTAVYQPKAEKTSPRIVTNRNAGKISLNAEPIAYRPQPASAENLAGEGSYLKTIATLTESVSRTKDQVMKASTRVEFERDLAVVDDAIDRMQKEIRKNPRNEAAKDVLRASYQNKIDLLNSVADKSELVASMR